MGPVQSGTPDRFADDPAFAVHEGGKLSLRGRRPIGVTRPG
jgi:malate dehydrogenase (oxaloacetate-decarboxylating)